MVSLKDVDFIQKKSKFLMARFLLLYKIDQMSQYWQAFWDPFQPC